MIPLVTACSGTLDLSVPGGYIPTLETKQRECWKFWDSRCKFRVWIASQCATLQEHEYPRNQGVNLLCREGNSQPGHWRTDPLFLNLRSSEIHLFYNLHLTFLFLNYHLTICPIIQDLLWKRARGWLRRWRFIRRQSITALPCPCCKITKRIMKD